MRLLLFLCFFFFGTTAFLSQNIEQDWIFESIEDASGNTLFKVNPNTDTFQLHDGQFQYSLAAKDSLKAAGDYIFQNNLLVLFYTQPKGRSSTYSS